MSHAARSLTPLADDEIGPVRPPPRLHPTLASSDAISSRSPARALQAELEGRLAGAPQPWSPRRTLAFTTLVCGSFWLAVIVAGARFIH